MESLVPTLLFFVPEPHRAAVEAVLVAMAQCSIALAVLKPLAARYVPLQWRHWADGLFRILDLIAVNTRGLHTRPARAPKK